MSGNSNSDHFAFTGLIAALIAGFLTYQLYQVTNYIQGLEDDYNKNFLTKLIIDVVGSAYFKTKKMIFVFLISYGIKTLICLKHAFVDDIDNSKYILYLFLAESAILGFLFGFEPFSDFFKNIFILGIPTFIIYALLDE
jgi:hypothetical protein